MCSLFVYVSVHVAMNEWGHKCAMLEVPRGCGSHRTTLVSVFLFNFVWFRSHFVISLCLPVYLAFNFSWFACAWLPAHHRSIGIIDVSITTLNFWGDLGTGTRPHIQVLRAILHVTIMGFVAVFLSSKHFRSFSETYAKFNNIRCSELHHWTEITMSIWPLQWCRPGAAEVSVKSFTSTTQPQRPCWLSWNPSLIL